MRRARTAPFLAATAAALAVALTSCSAGSSPTSEGTGANGATTPVDLSVLLPGTGGVPARNTKPDAYTPAEITDGMVRGAVAKVDDISRAVMQRSGIPGMAVAVVYRGQTVFARGYGVREAGKADLVDPATVFQIASVSKSISSTCIAKAVTDHKVAWTDPVVKYLPWFALSDPATTKVATIGDFFSHRTGLPGAVGDDLEGIGFDRDQILAKLALFPLDPFRISYHYTNFGMTTGGEAVAAATGMPWDQLCAQELFQPLKMTSSSYSHAEFLQRADRATLHFPTDGTYRPLYTRDADAQAPAGGVSSNVVDLAAWMRTVLADGQVDGQQVIDPAILQQSFTPQVRRSNLPVLDGSGTGYDRSAAYGYGVNVDDTSTGQVKWSHSGAFSVGAATAYAMIPAANVGIVVLTNASPVGAPEAVTSTFTDYLRTGHVERDWYAYFHEIFSGLFVNHSTVAQPAPAAPAAARPLSDYVGTYANAYLGDVTVAESGGRLTVTLGPKNLSAPLDHYDGDTFSWLVPGGNGDPVSAITFGGGGSGPATTMHVEAFLLGDLTRK